MAKDLLVRAIPALLVLLSGCSPPEPLPVDDRAGMVRFGTVIPATTSAVVPPEATGALEKASNTAPATTTSTPTTTSAVPSSTSDAQPTPSTTGSPDHSFTVARATGEWLDTYRSPVDTEVWWSLSNPGPYDGDRVVLVLDEQDDWLLVDLPVRPNGTMGWVRGGDVSTATYRARIIVDLYRGRLEAWENGALVAQGAIASGAEETPTPPGGFFVTEIQEHTDPATGDTTWLIGTSAYSEAIDPTAEGDPAVAILAVGDAAHLSQAISLGCVRIHPDVLERLALLPLGTPVQILG